MWSDLELRVLAFIRGRRCSLFDLVIDTTGAGVAARPCLALWAFAADDESSLDATVERAIGSGALEDVFDALTEVASDTPGIALDGLFTRWPEELDGPTDELAAHLAALVAAHPVEFAGVARIWLRFMGSAAPRRIR